MNQSRHCLVMRQEGLTVEIIEHVGIAQSIHNRALNLRQVQTNASIGKAITDCLEIFETGGVDLVHGRAHHHEVAKLGLLRNALKHIFFKLEGVGIGQTFIVGHGRARTETLQCSLCTSPVLEKKC